jgi:hypothetical protein
VQGLCEIGSASVRAGAGSASVSFPCQKPNNSNGCRAGAAQRAIPAALRRTAFATELNAGAFVERYGLERVLFLTLTFRADVQEAREAQRRFNSFATGVLRKRYLDYLRVFERQGNGRVHYHLLVAVDWNCRRGVDHAAIARRDYRTAPVRLRQEWGALRRQCPSYGFGRHEALPIRKSAGAMGRYVAGYITKDFGERGRADRGVRLFSCSRRARVATSRFAFASGRAQEWRRGVPRLIRALQDHWEIPAGPPSESVVAEYFGRGWRYRFRHTIAALGADRAAGLEDEFYWEIGRQWKLVQEYGYEP